MDHLQRHKKQLHYVVSKLDTNKDRRVTSAEIKVAFKTLGIAISLEETEKLVSRIDNDNSLNITSAEWRDYLMFHHSSTSTHCQDSIQSIKLCNSYMSKSKVKVYVYLYLLSELISMNCSCLVFCCHCFKCNLMN